VTTADIKQDLHTDDRKLANREDMMCMEYDALLERGI
jgi:hypothetical protein